MEIRLNDQNFDKEISESKKPVLVDFWAIWCGPCNMLSPILERLSKDYENKIILAKVNVDEAPIISQRFGIESIPTVVLFNKGKPTSGFIGLKPESEIRRWLEDALKDISQEEEKTKEENVDKLIKWYADYAERNGFRLNPNKEVVRGIVRGLLENEKKYGFRYCPCRRVSGNLEEDRGKICPCRWHKEEIEKNGHCHCQLFYKK